MSQLSHFSNLSFSVPGDSAPAVNEWLDRTVEPPIALPRERVRHVEVEVAKSTASRRSRLPSVSPVSVGTVVSTVRSNVRAPEPSLAGAISVVDVGPDHPPRTIGTMVGSRVSRVSTARGHRVDGDCHDRRFGTVPRTYSPSRTEGGPATRPSLPSGLSPPSQRTVETVRTELSIRPSSSASRVTRHPLASTVASLDYTIPHGSLVSQVSSPPPPYRPSPPSQCSPGGRSPHSRHPTSCFSRTSASSTTSLTSTSVERVAAAVARQVNFGPVSQRTGLPVIPEVQASTQPARRHKKKSHPVTGAVDRIALAASIAMGDRQVRQYSDGTIKVDPAPRRRQEVTMVLERRPTHKPRR